MNTPILAAASGMAEFKPASQSAGAGNMIKITHSNGYQTWYEHLDMNNLIVKEIGEIKQVEKGQKIGEVGMSGKTTGPHVHLSVFKVADDYPYGLTDPLGWEGNYTDPWTEWTNDPPEKPVKRYGVESYNLYIKRAPPKIQIISQTGGTLTTEDNKVQIVVPNNAFNSLFTLTFENGPFETVSDLLQSIVPSFFLKAVDNLGNAITQFLQPIQITYSYINADLFNIKENTLKLYFFNEVLYLWEALETSQIDTVNKIVTAQTTHFSHFALMGEAIDKVTPTTEIIVHGNKGQDNWYKSTVSVELNGKDNEGGSGMEYTLFTLDNDNWKIYSTPLVFDKEGSYTATYQSFDKAGNEGERNTIIFNIDKTPPEADIKYDLSVFDTQITGKDNLGSTTVSIDKSRPLRPKFTVADQAGNTLLVNTGKVKIGKQVALSINSLQYNSSPPVSLDPNVFFSLALTDKTNVLKQLDQYYSLKYDKKIFTNYTSSRNTTQIYTKSSGSTTYTKVEKPGVVLLKLTTDKGTLKYSY